MTPPPHRPVVLFVCTGNAGRSQMAHALLHHAAGDALDVRSAGVQPWDHLHPVPVQLMAERGLSMRGHHPKHVLTYERTPLDWVVTIGDRARDLTPELPGHPHRLHWDIPDPADADGTPDEVPAFRRALAAIEERLPGLLAEIERHAAHPSAPRS